MIHKLGLSSNEKDQLYKQKASLLASTVSALCINLVQILGVALTTNDDINTFYMHPGG